MSGGFYSVFLDGDDHTQWLLDDPLADGAPFDSGFAFGRAQRVEALGELTASVTTRPGEPRDSSWTISLVPIVTEAVRSVIESVTPGAVQWLPVRIKAHPGSWYIMNALDLVDSIDPDRTGGGRFPDAHERAGEWQGIWTLRLRNDLLPVHDIFRVKGQKVALVVTGRLKAALEDKGHTGMRYTSVTENDASPAS